MELKLSKKRGFVETFWNMYKESIVYIGKGFGILLVAAYLIYCFFCLFFYSCGFRYQFIYVGYYSCCFAAKISVICIICLIIYLIIREAIKIRLLQKVPITREEFQKFGCKTQEDVMVCLMLNRYFYVWKKQTYFEYPDYMTDDIKKTTESFPSILCEENIEVLEQTYKGPFSFKYFLKERKSGKGLGPYTDKYDYEFLRKYVTPELIPIYDKLYRKIKE